MLELEIGQEVRLFNMAMGTRRGWPEDGYACIVETIGRKYCTVEGTGVPHNAKFSLEDGIIHDDMHHYVIKTLERVELDRRMMLAKATLADHHIKLLAGHKYTLEQIECLAAVATELGEGKWT